MAARPAQTTAGTRAGEGRAGNDGRRRVGRLAAANRVPRFSPAVQGLPRVARTSPVARPFAGLAGDADRYGRDVLRHRAADPGRSGALRPAQLAERTVMVDLLPMSQPALVRPDGEIVLSRHTLAGGDVSRARPGAARGLRSVQLGDHDWPSHRQDGRRLQGPRRPTAPLTVTVHERFDWWAGASESKARRSSSWTGPTTTWSPPRALSLSRPPTGAASGATHLTG